jgi:hypothetical protein
VSLLYTHSLPTVAPTRVPTVQSLPPSLAGLTLLDVDAESREQSWMTPLIHGAPDVDFTDPEEDGYNVQVLVEWLGNRGKVRPPARRPTSCGIAL